MKAVCMVLGAGAGIGGTVGQRFAREGYHAVLCRRANEEGLNKLVSTIEDEGGEASGFILNAVEDNSIETVVEHTEREIGHIDVVIFNLGAQTGNHSLEATSLKDFELGWRLATFSLFRTAKCLLPRMVSVIGQPRAEGARVLIDVEAGVR